MNKHKRVIFAAGGTGGHLFPAQRIAEKLKQQNPNVELLFVGDGLKSNPFFNHKEFTFQEVSSAHFSKKNPFLLTKSAFKIFKGILESLLLIRRYKPDLIVGFGSFHTMPLLSAATLLRTPFILHEQNSIPGKVNRLFSPLAKCSAISFPESKHHLKGKAVETSFPLKATVNGLINDCYRYFNLDSAKKTILVLGGSQGAKSINKALKENVPQWKEKLPPFQLIHLTGFKEDIEGLKSYYKNHGIEACVKPFESNMNQAWQIADLVISRAGAATIFEEIYFEKPALLIPYPSAADNHQFYNAKFFTDEVKAGIILLENEQLSTVLSEKVIEFFDNDLELLKKFRKNIQIYKKCSSQEDLTVLIFNQLGQ